MLSLRRKPRPADPVALLHERLVAASRAPSLFGPGAMPDTVEGRFESLTLHVLLALRRLRRLPPPAGDVAQELVDVVFAHLEIALRESGIGDFGVPKRMKKLARAFYERMSSYDRLLDEGQPELLAAALRERLGETAGDLSRFGRYCLASENELAALDLDALMAQPRFATLAAPSEGEGS